MIDVIIAVFAIIILASAAIIGAVMVGLIVFGLRCIFGPCFDEHDEIHECPGCRYNPAYWDHAKYIGPSRRRLRKLRKEEQRSEHWDMYKLRETDPLDQDTNRALNAVRYKAGQLPHKTRRGHKAGNACR